MSIARRIRHGMAMARTPARLRAPHLDGLASATLSGNFYCEPVLLLYVVQATCFALELGQGDAVTNEPTTVPAVPEKPDTPRKRWTKPYVIQGVVSRETEGVYGGTKCEGTGYSGTRWSA
jgi:hypothetical protein